jgi:FMN reductase
MNRLVAVVGSVTPPGRLRQAVDFALEQAVRETPQIEAALVDLADYRVSFADGRPLEAYTDDTAAVVARLRGADAILLATPVYRASYTGSLKNLLDLTPLEALQAKPVGIVAMGATLHHYLGADWQLRAVLSWFGALTLPASVYLTSAHFSEGKLTDETAITELGQLIDGLINLSQVAGEVGPPPIAGRHV